MKKIFILFLSVFALSFSIKAQTQDSITPMNDIKTPFCTSVNSYIVEEKSYLDRLGLDVEYENIYKLATLIETYDGLSSTNRFNCHGYAWLKYLNDGIVRWIGYHPSEVGMYPDFYLLDGL